MSDDRIRARKVTGDGRVQPLIYAPAEGEAAQQGAQVDELMWFTTSARTLSPTAPDEDDAEHREGRVLPVLAHRGDDRDKRSRDDWCRIGAPRRRPAA